MSWGLSAGAMSFPSFEGSWQSPCLSIHRRKQKLKVILYPWCGISEGIPPQDPDPRSNFRLAKKILCKWHWSGEDPRARLAHRLRCSQLGLVGFPDTPSTHPGVRAVFQLEGIWASLTKQNCPIDSSSPG